MAQNKNALLRYHTIDRCLRNRGRRWTLDDLIDACSDALYEYEGKYDPVSKRTVQLDIQMMRSDRLGYEAPIEIYDRKYYRYADPDYSIHSRPLSEHDIIVLNRTIDLLRQFDEFDRYHDMADVVNRLQDKILVATGNRRPIVDFERNPNLKGLQYLNPLYDIIASRKAVCVDYQSFNARNPRPYTLFPYLLKEYRNRWFLFGARVDDMKMFNLALDRIVGFHACPEIPYVESPEFDGSFFDDVIGVTKHSALKKETVRISVDSSQAGYILTKPLHKSQRIVDEDLCNGSVIIEIDVVVNHELIALLMTFCDGIRVLSPQSVVDKMADIYNKGASNYRSGSSCV